MAMFCDECNKEITTIKGAAWAIEGYCMDRQQGGTNHVLWIEKTGRIKCSACVTRRKAGLQPVHPDQMTLV